MLNRHMAARLKLPQPHRCGCSSSCQELAKSTACPVTSCNWSEMRVHYVTAEKISNSRAGSERISFKMSGCLALVRTTQSPQEFEVGRDAAQVWLQKWRKKWSEEKASLLSSLLLLIVALAQPETDLSPVLCVLTCTLCAGRESWCSALRRHWKEKGSSTNRGNFMLSYPKKERRCPVSQPGDIRFT